MKRLSLNKFMIPLFLVVFINFILFTASCAQAFPAGQRSSQKSSTTPTAHFGNVLYTSPVGWQRVDQNGIAFYIPPNTTIKDPGCLLAVLPGEDLTGNFREWFKAKLVAAHQTGKVIEGGKVEATRDDDNQYDVLYTTVAFEDDSGARTIRFYLAAHPGNRAEMVGFFATSSEKYQQYQSVFDSFIKTVDFANVSAPASSPNASNNASNRNSSNNNTSGLSGLYTGTDTRQQFNPNTKFYDYIVRQVYYLFLPDGRVYFALPKGGSLNNFDFERARREDPNNCGYYQISGGQISIKRNNLDPQSQPFTNNRNSIQIGRPKLYPVEPAGQLKLDGLYSVKSFTNTSSGNNVGGVAGERQIAFNRNGEFREQGFVGFTGSSANVGSSASSQSGGAGRYEINGTSLDLIYSDGSRARFTFFVYPENAGEARPGLIVIDGVSYLLRN